MSGLRGPRLEDADLPGEEWRPTIVSGYQVSNLGRVRNARGRLLKPWPHRSGHLYVRLGEGSQNHQVHRLVLFAFVGPPPTPRHESLHGAGGPSDNRLSNLRWGTRRQNIDDLVAATGKTARSSLTKAEAAAARRELEDLPFAQRDARVRERLAKKYNVSRYVIDDLHRRQHGARP